MQKYVRYFRFFKSFFFSSSAYRCIRRQRSLSFSLFIAFIFNFCHVRWIDTNGKLTGERHFLSWFNSKFVYFQERNIQMHARCCLYICIKLYFLDLLRQSLCYHLVLFFFLWLVLRLQLTTFLRVTWFSLHSLYQTSKMQIGEKKLNEVNFKATKRKERLIRIIINVNCTPFSSVSTFELKILQWF